LNGQSSRWDLWQQKRIYAIVSVVIAVVVLATVFVAVPNWVEHSTFGRTFLDKPSFSVEGLQLSKSPTYGLECYMSSAVRNTGNVDISRLTLTLNGTYVWMDAWISPNSVDLNQQTFANYGSFHCSDVQAGQTYMVGFLASFADAVNQTASTLLKVGSS